MEKLVPLLSLDPSSTAIGWALLDLNGYRCSGVHHVPDDDPDERVRLAGDGVMDILDALKQADQPDPILVLIELPDYIADKARSTSIIRYFRAVGAVEHAVHIRHLPIAYVPASTSKEPARKEQSKKRFRTEVGRRPKTNDESDAYCAGMEYLAAHQATFSTPPSDVDESSELPDSQISDEDFGPGPGEDVMDTDGVEEYQDEQWP